MKYRGTKSDLYALAAEVDRVTNVHDIPQINIGGGIHGPPIVLTRGQPYVDGDGDLVYAVDRTIGDKTIADAIVSARSVVIPKTESLDVESVEENVKP